jgi:hypothetical protein
MPGKLAISREEDDVFSHDAKWFRDAHGLITKNGLQR